MKVSDFEIDFSSGLFTCCMSDVMERKDEDTYEGHIISCEECGEEMILRKDTNGVLWWTHT